MKTRSPISAALATVALLLLLPAAVDAQTVELRVHVTLEDGSTVPGAFVVLNDVDGEPLATGVTNVEGTASFPSIQKGFVAATISLEGFKTVHRTFQAEPGEPIDLRVQLQTAVHKEEVFVTGKVPVVGVTGASLSDPDAAGESQLCAVSPAFNSVTFGSHLADGSLDVHESLPFVFPSNCVINSAGTRAWVGNRAEGKIVIFDRVGSLWIAAGEVQIEGFGLGQLALSTSEDYLLASRLGFVDIFMTTPTGLDRIKSVELDGVRSMAALQDSAYATTDSGVYGFSFAGGDPPLLLDTVDGAFSLDTVADYGAIVALENAWRAYLGSAPPVRLWNITSRPGDIANVRGGVPYSGTPGTEPLYVFSDANQAKIGRMALRPDVDDDAGGLEVHFIDVALRDFTLTEDLPAPESLAVNSAGTVIATFPFDDAIVALTVDPGTGCVPGPTTACTLGSRFQVEADWSDFQGNTGPGTVVPGGSGDSTIFTFFDPDNWEVLMKTLDGCSINGHVWVLAAATTNVEYTLKATDTETGATREYTNPLGQAADATIDTMAFPCARSVKSTPRTPSASPVRPVTIASTSTALLTDCTDTDTELCLNSSRFKVEALWRDFEDGTGSARIASLRSSDSGLLWFFDEDNWEVLVKVLDGCGLNDSFWVFSAATTNVEYTLRVTDTSNGQVREYFNPLGQAAPALTDTSAFECGR